MKHKYLEGLLLFALSVCALWGVSPLYAAHEEEGVSRKIYLEHANTLSFNKRVSADYQILQGDVRFRQDSAYMYCDSAYFYEKSNSMDAFGNVRVEQGDSLYLFGDSLFYDGNTGLARLRNNVRLIHNDVVLYTDHLDYSRFQDEAHFFDEGVIVNPDNHLRSVVGWYYPSTRRAIFLDDVQLRHYDYAAERPEVNVDLQSDYYDEDDIRMMQLASESDAVVSDTVPADLSATIADTMATPADLSAIVADTLITPADSLLVDTLSLAQHSDTIAPLPTSPHARENLIPLDTLLERIEPPHASLAPDDDVITPQTILYSDTLHYNLLSGQADLYGPSRIVSDSSLVLTQRGYYNTKSDEAALSDRPQIFNPGRFATGDSAFYCNRMGFGEFFGKIEVCDTLQQVKLTGEYAYYNDSLESVLVTDNALAMEFSSRDTLYMHADTLRGFVIDTVRYMSAFYNVRYYRTDLQGVCDSLIYNARDSMATFIGNPVMWNGAYQITGDSIFVVMTDEGVDRVLVHDNAFLVQQKDTIHYDQISGKELICYFDSSQIQRMDMSGNIQIIFYPEESDKSLIGLNQVIGNYLSVWFKNQKMDHLSIWPEPIGSFVPMPLITDDILYLSNFRWMQYLRPLSPEDVFRDVRMKKEDVQEHIQLFNEDELNGY